MENIYLFFLTSRLTSTTGDLYQKYYFSFSVCVCFQDVYGSGGDLSDADRMALAIISYIGCGVSFLAMCLTIITFLMFK